MKKEIKKLSLNKKTISNLQPAEMNNMIGGVSYPNSYSCGACNTYKGNCGGPTKNGNTCAGHNTCQYTCV